MIFHFAAYFAFAIFRRCRHFHYFDMPFSDCCCGDESCFRHYADVADADADYAL